MEIKGYITRDKSGELCLWLSKPRKSQIGEYYIGYGEAVLDDTPELKDLQWGKVKEVTLVIKDNDATACQDHNS